MKRRGSTELNRNHKLAAQVGWTTKCWELRRQDDVQRFIASGTDTADLQMVDEGKSPSTPAVELSLTQKTTENLFTTMERRSNATPLTGMDKLIKPEAGGNMVDICDYDGEETARKKREKINTSKLKKCRTQRRSRWRINFWA